MSAEAKEHLKNQELFDVDEIFDDKSLVNAIGAIMESYAREYHAKKMEAVLEELSKEIDNLYPSSGMHEFYNGGFEEGAKWLLTHLKEQNK